MKTKLATQLFSESVADAMLFCKEHLQLKSFADCEATVKFTLMINNIFDILNSRSVDAPKYKKAMCNENITEIKTFYNNFVDFVKDLKLRWYTHLTVTKKNWISRLSNSFKKCNFFV